MPTDPLIPNEPILPTTPPPQVEEETCSPERVKARRALMKAMGQKEGHFPLTPNSAVISLTPSEKPQQDTEATLDLKKAREIVKQKPTSLAEWRGQMEAAALLNKEHLKSMTGSQKLREFHRNSSGAST